MVQCTLANLLAPISPLLCQLFKNYQCCSCQGSICSRQESIQASIEMEHKLLLMILSLLQRGFVRLDSAEDKVKIEEGLKILDIDLSGIYLKAESSRPEDVFHRTDLIPKDNPDSISSSEDTLNYPMDGCNSECETFDENHGVCYICDRQLPLNPAGYMKHIGIAYEVVIEYLEKYPKVKHIPPTIYEETAKQLLEPTKLSCGTDKGSLEKNPFD